MRSHAYGLVGLRARGVRWALALALAVVLVGVVAVPAFAGPVLRVDSLSDTTVAPGGVLDYRVQLTNVGDAIATSPIVVKLTLPDGVTGQSVVIYNDLAVSTFGWVCTGDGGGVVAGASVISCTIPDTVAVNSSLLGSAGIPAMPVFVTSVDGGIGTGRITAKFEVSGGGMAGVVTAFDPTMVTDEPPLFGADAFDGQVSGDAAGTPFTQAGGHPYAASTSIDFNTLTKPTPLLGDLWPVEPAKDVSVDLPAGFVGSPAGVARCTAAELQNSSGTGARPLCAPTSQVGTVLVRLNSGTPPVTVEVMGPIPLFNMVPPANAPARFGFNVLGNVVTLNARVRSDGDYGISVDSKNLSEGIPIAGTTLTLWGVPSAASHDRERACPGRDAPSLGGPSCASGAPARAFLRNPTSCTEPGVGLLTMMHLDSWTNPASFGADGAPNLSDPLWKSAQFVTHVPPAYPSAPEDWGAQVGTTGCDQVPFTPTLSGTPGGGQAKSNAPTGFTFDVNLPQSDDPNAIGEGDLKQAVVTLPAGVRLSPASAQGLVACSPAQIGLHSTGDAACPDASKVGSLTITTPLLDLPLTGAIYLATPNDNPFGSLVAVYLVAKGSGVRIKIAGQVTLDQDSGRVTTIFDNNPQTPFSNLRLQFDGGPHAPLVAPSECGSQNTTHAVLSSWSGATVTSDSNFTVSGDGNSGACPGARFTPGFSAGTRNPVAGETSTFVLNLSRSDQDEQLGSLTVDMPQGLTAKIAKATLCPEPQAKDGSCPESSLIGSVTVGAGAGPDPFYITNGRAYLTGPYKGAPFGLTILVPAVAGPFNLGNVVVRSAIKVDKHTTAVSVVSDPLPTILQGIPLDVRDVRVAVDKPGFFLNPTNCTPTSVRGSILSTTGTVANVSSRFAVTDCASLPLKPKMTLTVGDKHHTRARSSTPFTATLRQTPGQSNLKSVSVTLPKTLNAVLTVVQNACTQAQYNSGHCQKARAGSAIARTPLLTQPLRGSAYFVKHPGHGLPDLIVALRGQVDFDLIGAITIPDGKRLKTTFGTIPDVPITSFTLSLAAGSRGVVGTATNLCTTKSKQTPATLSFRAQNGRTNTINQRLLIHGCPPPKHHKHK